MRVSARTERLPEGVMVIPVLSLSKLGYLVVTSLSMALGAVWLCGELSDVAAVVLPATVASTIERSARVASSQCFR